MNAEADGRTNEHVEEDRVKTQFKALLVQLGPTTLSRAAEKLPVGQKDTVGSIKGKLQ